MELKIYVCDLCGKRVEAKESDREELFSEYESDDYMHTLEVCTECRDVLRTLAKEQNRVHESAMSSLVEARKGLNKTP